MPEIWGELEYRELFEAFPLSGDSPRGDGLQRLTRRLNHSAGGIVSQWDDARSFCRGSATAASDALQSYLDRLGLCRAINRSEAKRP
jgi:hypothetical protein